MYYFILNEINGDEDGEDRVTRLGVRTEAKTNNHLDGDSRAVVF